MRSASGRSASRVCMGLLASRCQSLTGRSEGFAHTGRSSAARNVMDSEYVLELHEIEEVSVEMQINCAQLLKQQGLQLARFVERQPYGFSDLLVRDAKRNALAYKIGGGCKRIHVARFRGSLHAFRVKLGRLHPSGHQGQQ